MLGGIVCYFTAMRWIPFVWRYVRQYWTSGWRCGSGFCIDSTKGDPNTRRIFRIEQKCIRRLSIWCGFSYYKHVLWVNKFVVFLLRSLRKCACVFWPNYSIRQVRQHCRHRRSNLGFCPKLMKWVLCWKPERPTYPCNLSTPNSCGRAPNSRRICRWCCSSRDGRRIYMTPTTLSMRSTRHMIVEAA